MRLLTLVSALTLAVTVHGVQVGLSSLETLNKLRLTTLVDLLKTAGLDKTLDDPAANLTIFAPSARALNAGLRNLGISLDDLKKDPVSLKAILLYHVIPGRVTTKDLVNEKIFTTASGKQLRSNHYIFNNYYFVDGSKLIVRNLETTNGVVHEVANVLFPFDGSVYDIIANSSDLSTLKAAIDATGLAPVLADQNPITIFCPTNDAFAALGNLVTKLVNTPDLLKQILLYHVTPGSLYRGGIHDSSLHTFEEKDVIALDHHNNYDDVDDARFSEYDISASNGVIHKIKNVLVPSSLEDQVKNL